MKHWRRKRGYDMSAPSASSLPSVTCWLFWAIDVKKDSLLLLLPIIHVKVPSSIKRLRFEISVFKPGLSKNLENFPIFWRHAHYSDVPSPAPCGSVVEKRSLGKLERFSSLWRPGRGGKKRPSFPTFLPGAVAFDPKINRFCGTCRFDRCDFLLPAVSIFPLL